MLDAAWSRRIEVKPVAPCMRVALSLVFVGLSLLRTDDRRTTGGEHASRGETRRSLPRGPHFRLG